MSVHDRAVARAAELVRHPGHKFVAASIFGAARRAAALTAECGAKFKPDFVAPYLARLLVGFEQLDDSLVVPQQRVQLCQS